MSTAEARLSELIRDCLAHLEVSSPGEAESCVTDAMEFLTHLIKRDADPVQSISESSHFTAKDFGTRRVMETLFQLDRARMSIGAKDFVAASAAAHVALANWEKKPQAKGVLE